ncbi:amino acid ABC transporter ATP-binding/permease protein [Stella sp.]|uniref:amino acid ABC transporter ATP-binding/permease protein n=1 Tax=Stella sp. TaxID=2912054 RepID=UPI0035B32793
MSARLGPLRPIVGLFLAGNRLRLLGGAALAAATALAGAALLALSGWFVTATAIAGLSVATALAFDVFAPSAGIRFLALARTAARYGERLATHDAALAVLAGLRERLFRGWAAPGTARDLARRPARLLFRLTLDIDALDTVYLRVLVPALAALAVALAAGLAFGLMQPLLGVAVVLFLAAVGIGLPIAAARAADRPARRRARGLEVLRSRTVDLVSGQTEWLMAGQLDARRDGLAAADRYVAESDDALDRIETWVGAGLGIAGAALLAGTLVAVALLVEADAIGAAVAALGVTVALAALEPFQPLRRGAVELGRTLLAARRLAPRLATASAAAAPAPPPEGLAVRLEGVAVRHPGAAAPALRGVTLAIGAGERIALVGPSGAGKSTLLALLAGEVAPEAGRAERRPATLLTQRTELFRDSLAGNLRLADPAADDARLLAALGAAGLRADVEALADGLATRLGDGGHGLSGGQARRLALARLFLRDTPIWLLDEPTEGQDGATARDVLARLAAGAAGRTVVVATHIRREAEGADRLIVLEAGTVTAIVERGRPGYEAALAALRPD